MAKEEQSSCKCKKGKGSCGVGGGAVYGIGLIGAAIYFIQHAPTFGAGIIGILKAIVWPALLVYKALELLKF